MWCQCTDGKALSRDGGISSDINSRVNNDRAEALSATNNSIEIDVAQTSDHLQVLSSNEITIEASLKATADAGAAIQDNSSREVTADWKVMSSPVVTMSPAVETCLTVLQEGAFQIMSPVG